MAHVRDPPINLSLSTTGVVGSVGVEVGADVGDSVGDAVLSHVGFVGVCVCVCQCLCRCLCLCSREKVRRTVHIVQVTTDADPCKRGPRRTE